MHRQSSWSLSPGLNPTPLNWPFLPSSDFSGRIPGKMRPTFLTVNPSFLPRVIRNSKHDKNRSNSRRRASSPSRNNSRDSLPSRSSRPSTSSRNSCSKTSKRSSLPCRPVAATGAAGATSARLLNSSRPGSFSSPPQPESNVSVVFNPHSALVALVARPIQLWSLDLVVCSICSGRLLDSDQSPTRFGCSASIPAKLRSLDRLPEPSPPARARSRCKVSSR
uniref:Uncharacterized protein n=1 Tax=Kalanchoe fedtschenkoi TaxID=63787 RepID=A0A7N0V925_KALFE